MSEAIASPPEPRTSTAAQIAWASGSFATGALTNAMSFFALFIMTTFLGIAPAVAGTIILVTKIYDGVIDPLIGAVSDRTQHRWGPRRIYLLIGALALGFSFAIFFNLSRFGVEGAAAGFLATAALLLYSTCYSLFTIPYLAMPPEIEPEYDGRTRLMSFRVFFLLAGVMAGSAGAPVLVTLGGGEQAGYEMMGLTLGGAAIVMCLIVFAGAAFLPKGEALRSEQKLNGAALLASPFVDTWRVLSTNAPFRALTLVKLCQFGVLATVLASSAYFFTFVLGLSQADAGQYFFIFSVSGILSIPAYRFIIAKLGKREVYLGLIVLYGLGIASWYLWSPGEADVWRYTRAVLIGSFSTGTLLCAIAMLPDTMEYDRLKSGEGREGVISGVFTFVENVGGALGPFVVGLILQAQGLIVSRDPSTLQPPEVLDAVVWCVSLVPAAFCFLAVPFLIGYKLDEAKLDAMREKTM
ncbi:MAG: MFS transporter [Pseudomonadota bacterium]